jgi:hypothetical protein
MFSEASSNRPSSGLPQYVICDAAYVSAIYEWAARWATEEFFDRRSHEWHGPQLDSDSETGASIGWFQGYARQAYLALRNNPALINLLDGEDDTGARAVVAASRATRPAPTMTSLGSPEMVSAAYGELRRALSDFENLHSPLVSLIAKVQLTLRYAGEVDDGLGARARSIPEPVLRWIIVCYESGGYGAYLNSVNSAYDAATAGSDVSLEQLGPGNRDRLRTTFNALGIAFAESFAKP